MAACEVCGNDYDKAFTTIRGQRTSTFEAGGRILCCARGARESGVRGVDDRA